MKRGTGGQKIAEYIEREAAFEAITDLAGKASTRSAYEAVWKSARALKKIPAADVAPVVHGRWENGNPICPVCGEDKFKDLDADIWCDWQPDFCPNCGAKMDGGADNG